MTDKEIRKRSVTAGDVNQATESSAVSIMLAPTTWSSYFASGLLEGVKGATGLPRNGSKNADAILSETPLIENMWASAINSAISRNTALGFTIEDATESKQRIKNAQKIMLDFDGRYSYGMSRHLRDFLTTDNGAFIEIVRQSNASGSRVIGLRHLDSMRCYRTGDPQRPVIYVDVHGEQHLLRDYQVIALSDMPSPRAEMWGVGICAARRAFEVILKMVAMETYVREKISGSRNLAIHIVNGISSAQLEGALISADNANAGKGFVVYKGSTIIPMLKTEPPSVVTIPLAEIPDGFEADSERRDAYLRYANALGIFVGEVQPLSGQGLGTGQQSVVLEQASEGRGLAAWRKTFEHEITHRVFPEKTTFTFSFSDTKDQQDKATTLNTWMGALNTAIQAKILTTTQALNVLVDKGQLPREFLQTDATAGGVVNDSESISNESNAERTIETQNGVLLDVEENKELRRLFTNLRKTREKALIKYKEMRRSSENDDETYNDTPPQSARISDDVLKRLMESTRVRAIKIAEEARG